MNEPMKLVDPIDIELEDAELTDELFAAFAPYRDGSDIARDVSATNPRADDGDDKFWWMTLMQAASFVPGLMLKKSVAKAGTVAAGGSLATKVGWKWIPGIAALPALVLVMSVLAVWFSMKSRGEATPGAASDGARAAVKAWWRRHVIPVVLLGAALVVGVFVAPDLLRDFLMTGIVLSHFVLVLILGRLASVGHSSRIEVGEVTAAMCSTLATWSFTGLLVIQLLVLLVRHDAIASFSFHLGVQVTFLFGFVICRCMATSRSPRFGARAYVLAALGLVAWPGTLLLDDYPVAPASVVEWVEAGESAQLGRPVQFDDLSATVRHLRAAGYEVDVAALGERMRAARRDSDDFNPFNFLSMLELDVADVDTGDGLPLHRPRLLKGKRFFNLKSGVIDLLIIEALAPFTREEKKELASTLRASEGRRGDSADIADRLLVVETLDALGASSEADAAAALALEFLEHHRVVKAGGRVQGFQPYADFSPDADTANEYVSLSATSTAVRLMGRAGRLPTLDLKALETYLIGESRWTPWSSELLRVNTSLASAALAEVRSWPEWQGTRVSPRVRWLFDRRLAFAALALVISAIVVTWRAPVRAERTEASA